MKRIIILLIFCNSTSYIFAQSEKDYRNMMDKFIKFYNTTDESGMRSLFSDTSGYLLSPGSMFNKETIKREKRKTGKLLSYQYLSKDSTDIDWPVNQTMLFIVECRKKINGNRGFAFDVALDVQKKITGYRFITTAPYKDSLIKAYLSTLH